MKFQKLTGLKRIDHLANKVDQRLLIKYNRLPFRNYFDRDINTL